MSATFSDNSSYTQNQSQFQRDNLRHPNRAPVYPASRPAMMPQVGMTRLERQDNLCNQLATRVIGGIALFLALILVTVSAIIFATPCCGDSFSNEGREEKCPTFQGETSDNSCMNRNLIVLSTIAVAIVFGIVGATIILAGECLYDVNDDREEQKVENFARMVKAQQIEMEMREREEEREARREEREARRAEKASKMSMDIASSYDHERTERINNMRRYSIGNPNTPSRRQQEAYYRTQGPQVVASQPMVYGASRNAGPAYAV